jgi:hypothetical protein
VIVEILVHRRELQLEARRSVLRRQTDPADRFRPTLLGAWVQDEP